MTSKQIEFKCGCETTYENRYRTKCKKTGNTICVCKQHKEKIKSCTMRCNCGNVETNLKLMHLTRRDFCSDCMKERKKIYDKKYKQKARDKFIYVFICGCEVQYNNLTTKDKNGRHTCPYHKMSLKSTKYFCKKCGEVCYKKDNEPSSKIKFLCEVCKINQDINKKKKYNEDDEFIEDNNYLRNIDCLFYDKCLSECITDNLINKKDSFTCKDCRKYVKNPLNIMEFQYNTGDSFDTTTWREIGRA